MAHRARPSEGVAWITGASTGIGRALAATLAARGWTVALTARQAAKLDSVKSEIEAAGGRCFTIAGDVTDEAAMADAVARIEAEAGPIALAIFNAGNYWPNSGAALDVETFRKTYAVNVFGVINGLAPVVERFKQRGCGHVVIVSSVSGYAGLPKASAYGSSKAALINMAESLVFDLEPLGIGVQLVNPGFIDTPLTEKNDFPMPALMPVERAARRLADGLESQAFEITFPRRFTWPLKLVTKLPHRLYFWLMRRSTGH